MLSTVSNLNVIGDHGNLTYASGLVSFFFRRSAPSPKREFMSEPFVDFLGRKRKYSESPIVGLMG